MKNKILSLSLLFLVVLIFPTKAQETFEFDVTEIEILENGNIYKGLKRGVVTSDNGITLESENFKYDKIKYILYTDGKVFFNDT